MGLGLGLGSGLGLGLRLGLGLGFGLGLGLGSDRARISWEETGYDPKSPPSLDATPNYSTPIHCQNPNPHPNPHCSAPQFCESCCRWQGLGFSAKGPRAKGAALVVRK